MTVGRVHCLAGVREAPMHEIAVGWQDGAAAYGDSAVAELAVMSMTSHPALQEAAARRARWR
jgi:hypothetical protein